MEAGGALQAGLAPRPAGEAAVAPVLPRSVSDVTSPMMCLLSGVGDTMLTGQMEDRPQVTWSGGRAGELYTIMILDEVRNMRNWLNLTSNTSGYQLLEQQAVRPLAGDQRARERGHSGGDGDDEVRP